MICTKPQILILVGSPREDGKSAHIAKKLGCLLNEHGANSCIFELSKYPVAACSGCNVCAASGQCSIVGDSFNVLSKHMDQASALIVVAPVYFAGPSGWLKAALDRCQVYWARRYILKQKMPPLRPAHLVVVGDGGDPFGYEPLETICTSALNSTGLRLDALRVHDFVGAACWGSGAAGNGRGAGKRSGDAALGDSEADVDKAEASGNKAAGDEAADNKEAVVGSSETLISKVATCNNKAAGNKKKMPAAELKIANVAECVMKSIQENEQIKYDEAKASEDIETASASEKLKL